MKDIMMFTGINKGRTCCKYAAALFLGSPLALREKGDVTSFSTAATYAQEVIANTHNEICFGIRLPNATGERNGIYCFDGNVYSDLLYRYDQRS